jgi:chemotaxis protein methyltransferase CheR
MPPFAGSAVTDAPGIAMSLSLARTEVVISDEEFARFCEFFYRKTGIMFDAQKKYFAERRITDRMASRGCATFREYFSTIRFEASGDEMQRLVNQMTVNETYFFREDYQLKALVTGMLPDLVARRRAGQPIRIWSVPCSSGEEPYSLAIYILENWADADRQDIEILASDIDSTILAAAAAGVYDERSLHRLSPDLVSRYFTKIMDRQYRISDDIRGSIDFSQGNVVDPRFMSMFRGVDVIFCRNMLIYFDDKSRRETVEAMYDCLSPGGYICLGHSESMSRISPLFRPRKYADTIIYQKPAEL